MVEEKFVQFLISCIPVLWALTFLGFILSMDFPLVNSVIWPVSYFLFFASYYSIFIWLIYTVILSIAKRKLLFSWLNLAVYIFGAFLFVWIAIYNPGSDFYIFLD
ncbi:MAG: hypothetical protein EOP53_05685 [Sphingobacteriales bacterium]|nr:MAG: hypothetical protein EOP53_05685 [Sphingobacteriales bacterium]